MVFLLTGRTRGDDRLRRRKGQPQLSNCMTRKRLRSALLPFGHQVLAAPLNRCRFRSPLQLAFNCFDGSAHVMLVSDKFSWEEHPLNDMSLGKTMFLASACAAGILLDSLGPTEILEAYGIGIWVLARNAPHQSNGVNQANKLKVAFK